VEKEAVKKANAARTSLDAELTEDEQFPEDRTMDGVGTKETDKGLIIQQILELGEEQGFVTIEDLLEIMPDAEENLEVLEDVFQALINAGIPYSSNGFKKLEAKLRSPETEDEVSDHVSEQDNHHSPRTLNAIDVGDTIGLYLSQASRVSLLTRDEEVQLAKQIERGREASKELAKKPVTAKRQDRLRHLIDSGLAAREHLILANLRLVFSVAKKYIGRGVPLMDLVQEGHIGLMRAAKKFDYRLGYKFSTYATWWIRQAVTRAIADQGRTIRLPVHMGDRISKMYRKAHRLTQEIGREPTVDELADALKEEPLKIAQTLRYSRRTMSLELPVGEDDGAELGDFIVDESSPAPEEKAMHTSLKRDVQDVLDKIPPREVRVLQMRFGLNGERMHTLVEVGKKMGITRERVRQIQARALRRLRKPMLRSELLDYVRD
jgi:RNA polymerase primary sigma factor